MDNFDNNSNRDLNSNDLRNSIDLNSFSDVKEKNASKDPKHFKVKIKEPKKITKATVLKSLLTTFLVLIITGCIVVGAFMVYAFGFVDSTMEEDLDDLTLNFTTTIYVRDGSTGDFTEYQRLHGEFNRIWVSDEDGNIPQNLKNAFIAVEDKRFKTHNGVDWKRTFSAFANLFFHFYSSNQGGSTITQQLVKNLTGDNSQSPSRKVREIMRARDLELRYSKDTILECYLNTVSMAGGMYGVEVASNYYFDKSTKDLTLTECAALASIVKAPEQYRPDRKPEANKARRQTVLKLMLEQGFIDQAQFDASYNEDLNIVANKENLNEIEVNSYFVDALFEDVVNGLMEKYGYDRTHAEMNFYNGGYKIYATLDPSIQSAAEEVFKDEKYAEKGADGSTLQGAMTIMDYEGHIVGMVGGIGEKTSNRTFNRATSAIRQPGSTMKPLSAYSQAIENNIVTYSSVVNDRDVYKYGDWKPNNWYKQRYLGDITIEYALEKSANTIPTWLVEKLTPQASFDYLISKFGLKNLNQNDINYAPLGMGGTNGGVTTVEEAAAYAAFGNGGYYYEPTTYYKVENQHGKTILEYDSSPVIAVSEDTATVMNHLLQNVVYGSEGTGTAVAAYIPHMKIYAKTGTSNEDMNSWFTGGTPYYVASVWNGYDSLQKISSTGFTKQMWGKVMSKVHSKLSPKEFVDSSVAVSKYYCTETGLLAKDGCVNKKLGWYRKSNVPGFCTVHADAAPAAPETTPSASESSSSETPAQAEQ